MRVRRFKGRGAALLELNLAEYINVFRYLKQSAHRGGRPLNNKELRGWDTEVLMDCGIYEAFCELVAARAMLRVHPYKRVRILLTISSYVFTLNDIEQI